MSNVGNIIYDPDSQRGKTLKQWFSSNNENDRTLSLNSFISKIEDVTINNVRQGRITFSLIGKISHVKNVYKYKACITCKSKLLVLNTSEYRCEKCKHDVKDFIMRVIINVLVFDDTGSLWMTIFQEKLELFFDFRFTNDMLLEDEHFEKWCDVLLHKKYNICVKSSLQSYNGKETLKNICTLIKKID